MQKLSVNVSLQTVFVYKNTGECIGVWVVYESTGEGAGVWESV